MRFHKENIETDVLVAGGGLAGCMAAIKASESRLRVTIVEKANTLRSGNAGTGIDHLWAYIPPVHERMGWSLEDLMEDHAQAVAYGGFMRWDLLRLIAGTSYDRVLDLEKFGVKFRYEDSPIPGKFRIVQQFHSNPSSFNFDGRDLKPLLTKEARRRGVKIVNRVMLTDLLTGDGQVCGAVGVSTREPKIYRIKAKTVVLTTSGRLSRMSRSVMNENFNRRLSPTGTTGEGILMALGAGAEVINLEFFGIMAAGLGFKNCSMHGGAPRNTMQPATRAVDAEGNIIVPRTRFYDWENLGKIRVPPEESRRRFMEERALRSRLVEAYKKGKGPLYFDLSEGTEEEIRYIEWSMSNEGKMWILLRYFKNHGIDLRRDKIEIGLRDRETSANAATGVWVDGDCESGISGLFVGGDQVGGVPWASAPGATTTGWHAGLKAAERAKGIGEPPREKGQVLERATERYHRLMDRKGGDSWVEAEYALQDIMDTYFGERTSEAALKRGLDRLEGLRGSIRLYADNPHDLMRCLEVENMQECARLILTAAKERKESRAFLKRSDFPEKDDRNWFKFLALKRDEEGRISFSRKPIEKQ